MTNCSSTSPCSFWYTEYSIAHLFIRHLYCEYEDFVIIIIVIVIEYISY